MKRRFQELLSRLEQLEGAVRELTDGVRLAVALADQDPEMSLTRSRKLLEYVVRDVYESRIGKPAGTQPLENLLQRIVKDGYLPRKYAAYANTVRELGNVGTHVFDESVSEADVLQSLTQLVAILEWYFQQRNVNEFVEEGGQSKASQPSVAKTGRVPTAAAEPFQQPQSVGEASSPRPVKKQALLDRRLTTELIVLLSRANEDTANLSQLMNVMRCGLAWFDNLLVENIYGSTLAALLRREKGILGDALIMVRRAKHSEDEDFDQAVDEATAAWASEGPFQLEVSRYDQLKGAVYGTAEDAAENLQQSLLLARHLDAAFIPHPQRWPLYRYWFERCIWTAGDEFPPGAFVPSPADPLSDAVCVARPRPEQVSQWMQSFPAPDPSPLAIARYGPLPYPFPKAALRHYDRRDLAGFPVFLYEFVVPPEV